MESNKGFRKGRVMLIQLIVVTLVQLYIASGIYKLQEKMDEVTKPLVASYVLWFAMVCVLVWQWLRWFKHYKEYRKGVSTNE